jgi:hypothetical protein
LEPTWDVFSIKDLALALIGFSGLVSVWVVLSTAFSLNKKRELSLRKSRLAALTTTEEQTNDQV